MNTDIRLSVGFWQHPKTKKTARRLGLEGVRSLQVLWLWAAINRPDGNLSSMDWEDIELAADWQGEEQAFFDLCLGMWIDNTPEGYILHDWKEHNLWAAEADGRSGQSRLAKLAQVNREAYDYCTAQGITSLTATEYADFKQGKFGGAQPPHSGTRATAQPPHSDPRATAQPPLANSTGPAPSPAPALKQERKNTASAPASAMPSPSLAAEHSFSFSPSGEGEQTAHGTEILPEPPSPATRVSPASRRGKGKNASPPDEPHYRTESGRYLTGKCLADFERFWAAFALAKGKAEAADVWLDIPQLTESLVDEICRAATLEARRRDDDTAKGKSPKWGKGWLLARRWEDYATSSSCFGASGLARPSLPAAPAEYMPTPEELEANKQRALHHVQQMQEGGILRGGLVRPNFRAIVGKQA